MSYKTGGRSGAFLAEMVVVLLFFSIASAIVLRLFVGAYTQNRLSVNTSQAILKAQSAAESYRATGDAALALAAVSADSDGGTAWFDRDWGAPSDEADRAFALRIGLSAGENSAGGTMRRADITVGGADGEILYSLTVGDYRPAED